MHPCFQFILRLLFLIGICLSTGAISQSPAAVIIGFDVDTQLAREGDSVFLEVEITYDASDPDGPTELGSYGVRLIPLTTIDGLSVRSITVPSELDYDGPNGPPAIIDDSIDVLGAKGTIEVFANPRLFYTGSLIVTYEISLGTAGDFDFGLDFYNTVGPTEDIFIARRHVGDEVTQMTLDPDIVFGETTIRVVPHPQVRGRRMANPTNDVEVRFDTVTGYLYRAEWSNNLVDWFLLDTIEGNGTEALFVQPDAANQPARFYQVIVLPIATGP